MIRPNTWLVAGSLLVLAAAVYSNVWTTPTASVREGNLEPHASAIDGFTAHEEGGRPLPLFRRDNNGDWRTAVPNYATALARTLASLAPSRPWSAPALFAIADVVLIYMLALRCFGGQLPAAAAALVLLATPAHVLAGRTFSPDGVWLLPFILGWAIGLTALRDPPSRRSRWALAGGVASLFLGMYTQTSAVLLVPVLATVTTMMFRRCTAWRPADGIPALALGCVALSPFIVWFVAMSRPDAAAFVRWLLQPTDVRSMFRAGTVLKTFWEFWRPSHLFFRPDVAGYCGVFLTPFVVPLTLGAYAFAVRPAAENDPIIRLRPAVAATCLGGPLIAATASPVLPGSVALVFVPFAVLVAVWGGSRIWKQGRLAGRFLVGALSLGAAFQAIVFVGQHTSAAL